MKVKIEEQDLGQYIIDKDGPGNVKMFFLEYYLHKICEKLINYSWIRLGNIVEKGENDEIISST